MSRNSFSYSAVAPLGPVLRSQASQQRALESAAQLKRDVEQLSSEIREPMALFAGDLQAAIAMLQDMKMRMSERALTRPSDASRDRLRSLPEHRDAASSPMPPPSTVDKAVEARRLPSQRDRAVLASPAMASKCLDTADLQMSRGSVGANATARMTDAGTMTSTPAKVDAGTETDQPLTVEQRRPERQIVTREMATSPMGERAASTTPTSRSPLSDDNRDYEHTAEGSINTDEHPMLHDKAVLATPAVISRHTETTEVLPKPSSAGVNATTQTTNTRTLTTDARTLAAMSMQNGADTETDLPMRSHWGERRTATRETATSLAARNTAGASPTNSLRESDSDSDLGLRDLDDRLEQLNMSPTGDGRAGTAQGRVSGVALTQAHIYGGDEGLDHLQTPSREALQQQLIASQGALQEAWAELDTLQLTLAAQQRERGNENLHALRVASDNDSLRQQLMMSEEALQQARAELDRLRDAQTDTLAQLAEALAREHAMESDGGQSGKRRPRYSTAALQQRAMELGAALTAAGSASEQLVGGGSTMRMNDPEVKASLERAQRLLMAGRPTAALGTDGNGLETARALDYDDEVELRAAEASGPSEVEATLRRIMVDMESVALSAHETTGASANYEARIEGLETELQKVRLALRSESSRLKRVVLFLQETLLDELKLGADDIRIQIADSAGKIDISRMLQLWRDALQQLTQYAGGEAPTRSHNSLNSTGAMQADVSTMTASTMGPGVTSSADELLRENATFREYILRYTDELRAADKEIKALQAQLVAARGPASRSRAKKTRRSLERAKYLEQISAKDQEISETLEMLHSTLHTVRLGVSGADMGWRGCWNVVVRRLRRDSFVILAPTRDFSFSFPLCCAPPPSYEQVNQGPGPDSNTHDTSSLLLLEVLRLERSPLGKDRRARSCSDGGASDVWSQGQPSSVGIDALDDGDVTLTAAGPSTSTPRKSGSVFTPASSAL